MLPEGVPFAPGVEDLGNVYDVGPVASGFMQTGVYALY